MSGAFIISDLTDETSAVSKAGLEGEDLRETELSSGENVSLGYVVLPLAGKKRREWKNPSPSVLSL